MRREAFSILSRRRLDLLVICTEANIRALTGIACDNAVVTISRAGVVFYTDFRYVPMVHRLAPDLKVGNIARLDFGRAARIGFEDALSVARFERLRKIAPRAKYVSITKDLSAIRAVKTTDEIVRLRRAAELNGRIWKEASAEFRAGMTEREMAALIRHRMIDLGDGEAFETIVCVGANAAECHHVPDGTVWNGRDGVLVDMGVRLAGYCSDMTRNILPKRMSAVYRRVHDLVLAANEAAIAAARPGMTGKALDAVARRIIREGGFGRCFGHSLGHGVGLEIHEAPTASRRSDDILKPGMLVTIEPGIYLEGDLGVRIEDLVLITDTGCEVLTADVRKE